MCLSVPGNAFRCIISFKNNLTMATIDIVMHDAEQVSESGWQEGGREDSEQVQHVDEQQ